jgi:hypothetical protein
MRDVVYQTKQVDIDQDSVYETFGIRFCNVDTFQTFPINAIVDIRRWPPLGGPTHSIAVERDQDAISFLETYYNADGEVIAWFQKSSDNDTVFFHGIENTFNPPVFTVDSSSYYIRSAPNPVREHMNIQYKVNEDSDIRLDFLSYEGVVLKTILNSYSCRGNFVLLFNCNEYDEGYYILRYTIGSHVYRVNVVILR